MTDTASRLATDKALAGRVAGGDRQAFDEFFREYFPRLFRFTLYRVNHDADLAEEVVQRTMCKVVQKMGTYRGEALLFTWLCQICRNETTSLMRQRRIESNTVLGIEDHPAVQAALESFLAVDDRPETHIRHAEIAQFVRATLDYLPDKYAKALEMKYIDGYSVAEIGTALGIGAKAAESLLTRARTAFREGFSSLRDVEPGFGFE